MDRWDREAIVMSERFSDVPINFGKNTSKRDVIIKKIIVPVKKLKMISLFKKILQKTNENLICSSGEDSYVVAKNVRKLMKIFYLQAWKLAVLHAFSIFLALLYFKNMKKPLRYSSELATNARYK